MASPSLGEHLVLRREQRVGGHGPQGVETGTDPEVARERRTHLVREPRREGAGLATLHDGARHRRRRAQGDEVEDRARTRGLAEHGDPAAIAAEPVGVCVHPGKGGELVPQTAVRVAVLVRVDGEVAERAESVVDGHDHAVTL